MNAISTLARVSAVAVCGLLLGCGGSEGGGDGAGDTPSAVQVELGQAVLRDYDVTVTALGSLVSQPGRAARVAAPGESVVTAVAVAPGDAVEAGDVLVELDRSVWTEQAREAEAALAAANEARDRAARLVERGILPAKDLEAATAAQASAQAMAADARRTLERGILRSPISGVVSSVTAALSQPVSTADVLVEVVDQMGVDALVQLTPEAAASVMPGDSVQLFAGLAAGSAALGSGVVKGVSAAVASGSGTVTARVELTGAARPLRSGLSVSARITVDRHVGAVVVPRAALVPVTNGVVVYVVDTSDVAHANPVVLGPGDPDSVEVTQGLTGTERVVTGGAYGIVDGATVGAVRRP